MIEKMVDQMGHEPLCAYTLEDGLKLASSAGFDVVFLDVNMPDGNGLDFIPKFQETASSPEVIILTGVGDRDGAEMAVRSGAWAYVQKGTRLQDVILPLSRALQYRKEKAEAQTPVVLKRESIVGQGPKIRSCLDMMAKAAHSSTNVLILGETGTGKELFARALHENSTRSNGPFVTVDCAALPDTLVESVLFGHAKGAYTGADKSQDGLVTQADKGTLFLDEVGELPLAVQKSFLRVLQERVYRPVGGQHEIKSDFRLVAATNRNLEEFSSQAGFRSDLLFRLRTFVLELPPLREMREEIKNLAIYHLAKICEQNNIGTKGLSPEFIEALRDYDWPGNVRELVNSIEHSVAAAQNEPTLYIKHLPAHIRVFIARSSIEVEEKPVIQGPELQCDQIPDHMPTMRVFRESAERQYLIKLIKKFPGDLSKACQVSGISKSRLYDLLKKYEIPRS